MEIDQLIPEAVGGRTDKENLWLACSLIERVERIRVRTVKDNTFEFAVTYYRWTLSVALPPRGGGLGWGEASAKAFARPRSPRGSPPTLALPHEGGGVHKLLCTCKLLLIERY